MRPTVVPTGGDGTAWSRSRAVSSGIAPEVRTGQIAATQDRELGVDMAEMRLDGLRGQEELGRDLAIAGSGGGETRDALLARDQGVAARDPPTPGQRAGDEELGV